MDTDPARLERKRERSERKQGRGLDSDPARLERKREWSKRKEGRGLGTDPAGRAVGIGRPWVRARESGQDQRPPAGGGLKQSQFRMESQENTVRFVYVLGPTSAMTRALAPQHQPGTTNNKHDRVWSVLLVPPERLLLRDSHVKRSLVQVAVEIFGIVRPWTRLSLCRLSVVGFRMSIVG